MALKRINKWAPLQRLVACTTNLCTENLLISVVILRHHALQDPSEMIWYSTLYCASCSQQQIMNLHNEPSLTT